MLKFDTDRMPTSWWLRPVSNAARVGEHTGVTWKFGAFALMGSWQWSNAKSKVMNGVNFEPDYNVFGIGATYSLSRRTNLYTSWASRDSDGTLVGNAADSSQFAVGIRHLF